MAKWYAGCRLADGSDFPAEPYAAWDAAHTALREMADAHHADTVWEGRPSATQEMDAVLVGIAACVPEREHAFAGNGVTFFLEARAA